MHWFDLQAEAAQAVWCKHPLKKAQNCKSLEMGSVHPAQSRFEPTGWKKLGLKSSIAICSSLLVSLYSNPKQTPAPFWHQQVLMPRGTPGPPAPSSP